MISAYKLCTSCNFKRPILEFAHTVDAEGDHYGDICVGCRGTHIDFREASLERPLTKQELYYVLERWSSHTLYNAMDLSHASAKKSLSLREASVYFDVYDCTSSLVASPKELFSQERTLKDADQTVCAMLLEAANRGWQQVEFVGPYRSNRVIWAASQVLEERGKKIELLYYRPSIADLQTYAGMSTSHPLRVQLQQAASLTI